MVQLLAVGFALLTLYTSTSKASISCELPHLNSTQFWSSSQFYQKYPEPSVAREIAVVEEVLAGNIPEWYRKFIPIEIQGTFRGEEVSLRLNVAPDYLAIGTDQDFVRVPLTSYAAQYIASALGFLLPTPHLVDVIFQQAQVKLLPQPTNWYEHSGEMRKGSNYVIFNQSIEVQKNGRVGLTSGDKKDVVVTNLLDSAPSRVAIYGWHQANGVPLQPLGVPHDLSYEDYSHGIRFVESHLQIISKKTGRVRNASLVSAYLDPDLGAILNGQHRAIRDIRAARRCSLEFTQAMRLPASQCPPAINPCAVSKY